MKDFEATHHGKLHGIPVWLDMSEPEMPGIKAKYKLDFLLDIAEILFEMVCRIRAAFDENFEPMYPIEVGQRIDSEQP